MTKLIQMPQRLASTNRPGELLKRPLSVVPSPRRTNPDRDESHLKLIRQCPCLNLNCGAEPCEAAHIRISSAAHGKPKTGLGQKPPDRWTVPLCSGCHTRDRGAQHRIGEITFWHKAGLNPIIVAKQLYEATGDLVKMRAICFNAIAERESSQQMQGKR